MTEKGYVQEILDEIVWMFGPDYERAIATFAMHARSARSMYRDGDYLVHPNVDMGRVRDRVKLNSILLAMAAHYETHLKRVQKGDAVGLAFNTRGMNTDCIGTTGIFLWFVFGGIDPINVTDVTADNWRKARALLRLGTSSGSRDYRQRVPSVCIPFTYYQYPVNPTYGGLRNGTFTKEGAFVTYDWVVEKWAQAFPEALAEKYPMLQYKPKKAKKAKVAVAAVAVVDEPPWCIPTEIVHV
jgi:hypothetical protein